MRARIRRTVQRLVTPLWARRSKDPERKDVLFLCQNGLMADYLGPIHEALRDDPRLRFFVTHPRDAKIAHEIDKIRAQIPVSPIRLGIAECRPWDLIVTADHGYAELATRRRCPVIYTGHGMTGKVVEGEEGDYGYGPRCLLADGTARYSAMLEASEANRTRILEQHASLASVIRVVGSLQDDRLLSRLPERAEIRERLGYGPDDRVVLVQSSWGPQSLFQTLGQEFLEAARGLTQNWQFILSVHPHEYRPTEDGSPSWGERLRAVEGKHFRVREPAEPWIPEMVAADLVISDHTSLVIYAALAKKPTLWTPVPERFVQAGTALAKLRSLSPTLQLEDLSSPGRLARAMERALADFPAEAAARLSTELNSCPGEARARLRALVGEVLQLPGLDEELEEICDARARASGAQRASAGGDDQQLKALPAQSR